MGGMGQMGQPQMEQTAMQSPMQQPQPTAQPMQPQNSLQRRPMSFGGIGNLSNRFINRGMM
jgi:hypothetical protein